MPKLIFVVAEVIFFPFVLHTAANIKERIHFFHRPESLKILPVKFLKKDFFIASCQNITSMTYFLSGPENNCIF